MTPPKVDVTIPLLGWTYIGGPSIHLVVGLPDTDARLLQASDAADLDDLDAAVDCLTDRGVRNAPPFVGAYTGGDKGPVRVVAYGATWVESVSGSDSTILTAPSSRSYLDTDLEGRVDLLRLRFGRPPDAPNGSPASAGGQREPHRPPGTTTAAPRSVVAGPAAAPDRAPVLTPGHTSGSADRGGESGGGSAPGGPASGLPPQGGQQAPGSEGSEDVAPGEVEVAAAPGAPPTWLSEPEPEPVPDPDRDPALATDPGPAPTREPALATDREPASAQQPASVTDRDPALANDPGPALAPGPQPAAAPGPQPASAREPASVTDRGPALTTNPEPALDPQPVAETAPPPESRPAVVEHTQRALPDESPEGRSRDEVDPSPAEASRPARDVESGGVSKSDKVSGDAEPPEAAASYDHLFGQTMERDAYLASMAAASAREHGETGDGEHDAGGTATGTAAPDPAATITATVAATDPLAPTTVGDTVPDTTLDLAGTPPPGAGAGTGTTPDTRSAAPLTASAPPAPGGSDGILISSVPWARPAASPPPDPPSSSAPTPPPVPSLTPSAGPPDRSPGLREPGPREPADPGAGEPSYRRTDPRTDRDADRTLDDGPAPAVGGWPVPQVPGAPVVRPSVVTPVPVVSPPPPTPAAARPAAPAPAPPAADPEPSTWAPAPERLKADRTEAPVGGAVPATRPAGSPFWSGRAPGAPAVPPVPAAVPPPAAEPAPTSTPTSSAPGDPEVDDRTVDRSALRAAAAQAGPQVMATLCPQGHLNPSHASRCRSCGALVPDQQPFSTARPPLGVLRMSSGDVVRLDRGVLLGRAPTPPTEVSPTDRPHVVKVASPEKDVSRNHLEVTLDGWHVLIRDLNTTNGTIVTLPGQPPLRLRPDDRQVIEPGTAISLADEVELTYEVES